MENPDMDSITNNLHQLNEIELRKLAKSLLSHDYSFEEIAKTLEVTEKNVCNWLCSSALTEAEWEEMKSILEQAKRDAGPSECEKCLCNICCRYVDFESCNEYSFDRELGGCEKGGCITCNGHMRNNCDDFIKTTVISF
ncbi:MAG TPA: hypothetical protein GXX25_08380 [Desulfotomaculum sp.]|nr:hypothetical protein [Desulfotomaculum sp.]